MVQQLGNFLSGGFVRFVLRGHPDFGGLFDHLLADAVDSGVQFGNRARTCRAGRCFLTQFCEQRLEILHALQTTCLGAATACWGVA
ncbi:hypothetical protein D3C73_1469190 [compost metagenome]